MVLLFLIGLSSLSAQSEERGLEVSVQTDLIAYTTPGGWSAWLAIQHHQNKISFAYVNFPDRYVDNIDNIELREADRFFRIQYAHYFNPERKLKNFYPGINFEYHLREIEESNSSEVLVENGFKIAPILGYEWHPWNKRDNALSNFSLGFWAGPTFLIGYDEDLVFTQTGNVYAARESIEVSVGLILSYTIFKNY